MSEDMERKCDALVRDLTELCAQATQPNTVSLSEAMAILKSSLLLVNLVKAHQAPTLGRIENAA